MRFCVVRHPEAGVGTVPESALPINEAKGWVRVSDWADDPNDLDLTQAIRLPGIDPAPVAEEPAVHVAEPAAEPAAPVELAPEVPAIQTEPEPDTAVADTTSKEN